MLYDCYQKFPDVQVIELYAKLDVTASTSSSSQWQINRDGNVEHNIGWKRTSSAWPINKPKNLNGIEDMVWSTT